MTELNHDNNDDIYVSPFTLYVLCFPLFVRRSGYSETRQISSDENFSTIPFFFGPQTYVRHCGVLEPRKLGDSLSRLR